MPATKTNPSVLVFENSTILDPLAFELLGVHSKPDTKNPIGQFGTGLKYAICILLRENITFVIHTHGKTYNFSTINRKFRDETLQQVTCNDKELGFTTHYGAHWTLQDAYRELYCNTRDEGGTVRVVRSASPTDFSTCIEIHSPHMLTCHSKREKEFLFHSTPIAVIKNVELHPKASLSHVYYKGVRVNNWEQENLFSYSLLDKDIKLTEDRTVTNETSLKRAVCNFWLNCTNEALLTQFVTAPDDTMEGDIDLYCYGNQPCEYFLDFVTKLYNNGTYIPNKSIKRILIHYRLSKTKLTPLPFTSPQALLVDDAITLLKRGGYYVTEFKLALLNTKDSSLLGRAEDETIFLTSKTLAQSPIEIASTILEEYFHLKHGYEDLKRNFQTFLHDQIINQIN